MKKSEIKVVAWDKETIANPKMFDILPDLKADKGFRSPEKIKSELSIIQAEIDDPDFAELPKRSQTSRHDKIKKLSFELKSSASNLKKHMSEKKDTQIKNMGMDPLTNMICCVTWHDANGPAGSIFIEEATPEAEKELLMTWWEAMSKYDRFITFNGRSFDLRCALLHGMEHGIRPPITIDGGRYNRGNHIDLRFPLAGESQFAKGKLDFFAQKFLGDQKTEGMTGDQVQSYFDMGLHDDIEKYCRQDTKLTFELYEMALIAGLLEG